MLTVGSLFSGIGGIDLGLERAGMKVRWQVEIDAWCREVLAAHFPQAQRFADVRDVGQHNLSDVDLIAGGFPCQDISKAGNGAGIAIGTRSGLWFEFSRIIGEVRPRYVLVENVSALLARGLGRVIGDLAALGYDAEWDCVPAAALGAPHLRDRVWILAYPNGQRHIHGETQGFAAEAGESAFGDIGAGRRAWSLRGPAQGLRGDWLPEPNVGRVVDGLPTELDRSRIRGLGNAVVPQVVEWIGKRIIEAEAEMTQSHRLPAPAPSKKDGQRGSDLSSEIRDANR